MIVAALENEHGIKLDVIYKSIATQDDDLMKEVSGVMSEYIIAVCTKYLEGKEETGTKKKKKGKK